MAATAALLGSHGFADRKVGGLDLRMNGVYVEGCSCAPPCPCELTGVAMGCEGVGFFSIQNGSFAGASVSGVRFAYATKPGDYVIGYVDAPNAAKRKAGENLIRTAFKDWGKMEAVRSAKIAITGSGGTYSATVDGGKVCSLTTKPILGSDKRHPIVIDNINSPLHPQVKQGRIVKCSYTDGDHHFDIEGQNAYFNDRLNVKSQLK